MKNILVFILDRNPVQGNFIKYNLNSAGIKDVVLYQSIDECLYSIRKANVPGFIIADATLKGTTDKDFLKLIAGMEPSVKVIFHSEEDDISYISELLDSGATDFIVRVGGNWGWIRELTSNLQYLIKAELHQD